jgi:SAM-dependent methyltransferase
MSDNPERRRGDPGWSRSLAQLNAKFPGWTVQGLLAAAPADATVLEIGVGEGRALMEIRRAFPEVELFAVNRHPDSLLWGPASFAECAVHYGVFPPAGIDRVKLPVVDFYDAQQLRFEDATFDLVVSQMAIPYIVRKDWLLREVWRVLRPGGYALLHVDTRMHRTADFMAGDTPRWVLRGERGPVPLRAVVAGLVVAGVDAHYLETPEHGTLTHVSLVLHRTGAPLRLGWDYDDIGSFDLNLLNLERPRWNHYWGYRSAYRV